MASLSLFSSSSSRPFALMPQSTKQRRENASSQKHMATSNRAVVPWSKLKAFAPILEACALALWWGSFQSFPDIRPVTLPADSISFAFGDWVLRFSCLRPTRPRLLGGPVPAKSDPNHKIYGKVAAAMHSQRCCQVEASFLRKHLLWAPRRQHSFRTN